MKILIIKLSSFGDIIQCFPVASGLAKKFPSARIDWVSYDNYRELISYQPAISRIYTLPHYASAGIFPSVVHFLKLLYEIKKESYDIVLDLQGLFRSGILCGLSGAKRKIGPWNAREGSVFFYRERIMPPPPPAQERYLEFLRYLGIEPDPYEFNLPVLPQVLNVKNYVVVHPYSRWRSKIWPWRNYLELTKKLPQYQFVFIGIGPWFPINDSNCIDCRGEIPLNVLMAIIGNAQATISGDSGPAHLSAALGCPTLVMFGPTDASEARPIGKKVIVVQSDVPCSPCWHDICLNKKYPMCCLSEISVEIVIKKLMILIKN
ncbi:glycosyltransferase family 9 protein [Candidatus Methylacidiphilum infernorum]|uniref:ADP-heptose:LPS heptosyltransferase n=1 Tax=Methylacidiphilum infernorum (isolate V4) TaxID=481448 RepID=B3DXQ6_METI4|nr:glycosyltransferase family 9 protein [Candidatus Methylacidiphilum infernorum]ACD82290.1 ADP-heptose:LPS heptosyltransferase [Methylacidiphilum infernorum V4]